MIRWQKRELRAQERIIKWIFSAFYGMRLMGDALKESSSGALKVAMEHVTNNPVKAFLLGLVITAII